jgi:hypothetical protein
LIGQVIETVTYIDKNLGRPSDRAFLPFSELNRCHIFLTPLLCELTEPTCIKSSLVKRATPHAPLNTHSLPKTTHRSSTMQPSPLVNPQVTPTQLETSGSQLDGIPRDLEDSVRFAGAQLTQAAGVLLRLPQEVVAQAIIVFMRFWVGSEGGSLAEFDAVVSFHPIDMSLFAHAL